MTFQERTSTKIFWDAEMSQSSLSSMILWEYFSFPSEMLVFELSRKSLWELWESPKGFLYLPGNSKVQGKGTTI